MLSNVLQNFLLHRFSLLIRLCFSQFLNPFRATAQPFSDAAWRGKPAQYCETMRPRAREDRDRRVPGEGN